jgi:hypothetical protein
VQPCFRPIVGAAVLAAAACLANAADADPIIGTWVGTGNHEGRDDKFRMRLTFVSPRGGVSRYLDVPCGGVLAGGPSGDTYEFTETITFNGAEERSDNYCVSGRVSLSVDGSTMKYEWLPTNEGEELAASGTLERVGRGR